MMLGRREPDKQHLSVRSGLEAFLFRQTMTGEDWQKSAGLQFPLQSC
jgi:hypothetical protein